MTFDVTDMLAFVSPYTVLISVIVGVSMGATMIRLGHALTIAHTYYQIAGGFAFFIPIAIVRAAEGLGSWEKTIATGILWCVFVIGMRAGNVLGERRRRSDLVDFDRRMKDL